MTFRADGCAVEVVHFPGHVNFWCSGEPNWLASARSTRLMVTTKKVGRHDSRQATHMEDEMHGWDVQRMLVDTRFPRLKIISLSKCLPQIPTFGGLHQRRFPYRAGVRASGSRLL